MTGWLNRRGDEIDDGSSSGTVDEGRRGVAVDDVVGEEAPAGWRTEEGVGLRGFSRPRCTNGWADGMGVGNHGLGTRLSEMWGKLRKYPHRFEAVLSVQGYHGHFACRDFTGGGSFRARCNFGIARRGLRWRELSEHNETKIYLKYFGLTRRGLKFPDKPNVYCTKSMRTTNVIQNFEFMLCSIKIFRYVYNACNLLLK